MRDHNKAFCSLVAETLDCPGPVFEFGSYQVDGQEGYANLRQLFATKSYVGCDMRPGPGVDRVEDVTAISLPDESAGTVLCIETFEHVFEVSKAFDEVFRLLKPGGVFVITSPLNFRIHGYPDDYWRMTPELPAAPSCRPTPPESAAIRAIMRFHTRSWELGSRRRSPLDCAARLERLVAAYQTWLERTEASLASWREASAAGVDDLSIQGRAAADRRLLRGGLHDRPRTGVVRRDPRASIRVARRGGPLSLAQWRELKCRGRGRLGTIPCQRPSIDCLSWAWTVRPGPCWTRCDSGG